MVADRYGYVERAVDPAGSVVDVDVPSLHREAFRGRTLQEARAWCLVWLKTGERNMRAFAWVESVSPRAGARNGERSMRIVIAGPPKTGNVWLKCLLAAAYGLEPIGPREAPAPTLDAFVAWVGRGRFRDDTIFHRHFAYSPALADAVTAVPARLATILRDPYDAFVSLYFNLQHHADDPRRLTGGRDLLIGRPLDHPDVLAYLRRDGFRGHLEQAAAWLRGGRSAVVRYEDLHRDPVAALERLAAALGPVERPAVAAAVAACTAERMRQRKRARGRHVRAAVVGDSRDRLNDDHLALFRDRYGDLIRGLGYEVR